MHFYWINSVEFYTVLYIVFFAIVTSIINKIIASNNNYNNNNNYYYYNKDRYRNSMGQTPSVVPEEEEGSDKTKKHGGEGEDSTNSNSNCDDDDDFLSFESCSVSLEPTGPEESSSESKSNSSISNSKEDRPPPNTETKTNHGSAHNTSAMAAASNDTTTIIPTARRRLLVQPSTPSQWMASFRTSTDEELVSLLEQGCGVHGSSSSSGTTNYLDLSPLCLELRTTASRIREYRELEKTIASNNKGTTTTSSDNDTTASSDNDTISFSTVCFYDVRSSSPNNNNNSNNNSNSNNSNTEEDHDLIDLCERILRASSSRHAKNQNNHKKSYHHHHHIAKTNNSSRPIVTLSRVRQKLVPSKLKEHVFWESLWVVLYERKKIKSHQEFFKTIIDTTTTSIASTTTTTTTTTKKRLSFVDDNNNNNNNNNNRTHDSSSSSSSSTSSSRHQTILHQSPPNHDERIIIRRLEEQLRTAQECISGLVIRYNAETSEREEIETLVEKMWEMVPKQKQQQQQQSQGDKIPTTNANGSNKSLCVKHVQRQDHDRNKPERSPPSADKDEDNGDDDDEDNGDNEDAPKGKPKACQHVGTWNMSKDSIEFLAFPSEAKESLRNEKQKRLLRVREEMAFILDSDDPQDSHGEWSCCHKTNYNATCGLLLVGE